MKKFYDERTLAADYIHACALSTGQPLIIPPWAKEHCAAAGLIEGEDFVVGVVLPTSTALLRTEACHG